MVYIVGISEEKDRILFQHKTTHKFEIHPTPTYEISNQELLPTLVKVDTFRNVKLHVKVMPNLGTSVTATEGSLVVSEADYQFLSKVFWFLRTDTNNIKIGSIDDETYYTYTANKEVFYSSIAIEYLWDLYEEQYSGVIEDGVFFRTFEDGSVFLQAYDLHTPVGMYNIAYTNKRTISSILFNNKL